MAENDWNNENRSPEETPRRPNPSREPWDGTEPPPKTGMSGGMKAFLIILAIFGTCCVLCCGIAGYFVYSVVPKVSQNPAEVNAARDDLAKIQLPPGFAPLNMVKMDNFMMLMTQVEYRNPAINGRIMLASMRLKVGQPAQQDQAVRQQLEGKGFGTPKILTSAKTTTKPIKIKGKECEFTFKQGDDPATKKKVRQISGVFDGNHGPVSITIEMDESAYKEDAVVKMLETIQ